MSSPLFEGFVGKIASVHKRFSQMNDPLVILKTNKTKLFINYRSTQGS